MSHLLALVLLGSLPAQPAAPAEKPGDKLMAAYLAARTEAMEAGWPESVKSADEWEAAKPKLREQYFEMLGLWPLPEKTPLNAKVTGTVERADFVVEKLHFQSKPGLYVTGNLYRPKEVVGKLATVLYVCGHDGQGRNGNKVAFQKHGIWFATHNYVCLIIDTLQLGEIAGIHHGTHHEGRWWWQAAGYTPAGVECWNGVRAIDYLVTRPDVDADRIAVTGISGGGAATFWIAAADERVKLAVPVSGMSDLTDYVPGQCVNGHCDCMFLINTHQWNWTTIAGLVAPRPLLFANSDRDRIFPMPGNERIRARLEKLYGLYGPKVVAENFAVGVVPGGHADKVELRLMAYRWINKHLKKDNAEVAEPIVEYIPGLQLRVFPTDADLPADRINATIDETFVPRADVKVPTSEIFGEWKRKLLTELDERCFGSFSGRPSHPEIQFTVHGPQLNGELRHLPRGIQALLFADRVLDPDRKRTVLWTELGMPVGLSDGNRPSKKSGEAPAWPWLVVLNPGETLSELPDWAKATVGSDPYTLLAPRGVDETAWTQKNPPNTIERSLALLGATADGGRVWDVKTVLKSLGKVRVIGKGNSGVIAAYAALYEPKSVLQLVLVDPPTSHKDGPIFLNVLRVLDIPDALGMLAPKPLTIIGAKAEAFEKTKRIYKAAGAGDLELIIK